MGFKAIYFFEPELLLVIAVMTSLEKIRPPDEGSFIEYVDSGYRVPSKPSIAYIEGDGIGPEVVGSARRVLDAAVERVYWRLSKDCLVGALCRL